MYLFELPIWLTGFNFLVTLFGILIVVAGGIVVILAKGRGETATIQVDRAIAAEALVKTRDAEIQTFAKKIADIEEELEELTAEHRTLVGINIAKLMEFWGEKEDLEAQLADKEKQIRILKKRKDGD